MDFSKILILDGGIGTMLQRYGLTGESESFNLSRPEIIEAIHREYVEAGADIIETNTFGANYESALAGAQIARRVADSSYKKVWVAGSVGPTSKSLSMAIEVDNPAWRPVDFDSLQSYYSELIRGLKDGGVDMLLIETAFDALNVKAAICAAYDSGLPVMISATSSDKSGRTLTGQTIEAFYTSVRHCRPISFGLNCSLGAKEMHSLIADCSKFTECALSCYPNAGLPNEMGQYDQSPEEMARHIRRMAEDGLLNIVGGCCGTTPEHIKAIAEVVKDIKPRAIPERWNKLHLSGLESVCIDLEKYNFTNIGERTNVAGSRKFARLISGGEYSAALEIAAQQIEGGASVIDINLDDAMLDSTAEMQKFIRYIASDPAVSKAALMIDSSHWDTILTGLKNAQGKCVVNSISLKEGESEFRRKAEEVLRLGAAIVVMAFDEKGQATDFERKIEICERAYRLLMETGFDPCDIIFDVNVLSVGTGEPSDRRYAIDFIEAVRWIKQNLPGALTSGGISNLSFSFRGNNTIREAMHSVFLYHAVAAGLDMGIVNPGMLQIYDQIDPELRKACEDVILDSDDGAAERLLELASRIQKDGTGAGTAGTDKEQNADKELNIVNMLVKGISEGLESRVLQELQNLGNAQSVIEGPLMEGMEKVGELFADGKMFLPQVMKSAKIMKEAVGILQPYLDANAESEEKQSRDCIVIATVKGDVHDIGKNITATVLRCNGFNVVDLGVMVDNESILEAAIKHKAVIVAVSGLITPSLSQMEELCRMMKVRDFRIPLFIGGATTSALHTAVKLSPLYDMVFYGPDASATAVMAKRYMIAPGTFTEEERAKLQNIRLLHENRERENTKSKDIFSVLSPDGYLPYSELACQNIAVSEYSVSDLKEYIDWNTFCAIWRIKASDWDKEEVKAIKKEAEEALEKLECRIVLACQFTGDGTGCFAGAVHGVHEHNCKCPACRSRAQEEGLSMDESLRLTLADAISGFIKAKLCVPETYKVILPGIGYPSCPEHRLKEDVLASIPDSDKLGIKLTETYSMLPDASVCGYVIVHRNARYL